MKLSIVIILVLAAFIQQSEAQAISQVEYNALPVNPNTNLRWNRTTGVQYDPNTLLPVETIGQLITLYGETITLAQVQSFFPAIYASLITVTTAAPVSRPTNPNTNLPWDPATGIQYTTGGIAITSVTQLSLLYPNLTPRQQQLLFPYLFVSTTSTTTTTAATRVVSIAQQLLNAKVAAWRTLWRI